METRTIWPFCPASFTSHVFRLPPCCSTDQFFSPFHDWIIFHHVDAIFYLSLPQSRDIWVVSAFWLLWIVLLWIFMPTFLFEHLSVLPSIYVRVGSLGHMVLLYLTYWRIKKTCFPQLLPHFLYLSAMNEGSSFLTCWPILFFLSCLLIITIPVDVKSYLLVVLFCISFTTIEVKHLFMYLLAICLYS